MTLIKWFLFWEFLFAFFALMLGGFSAWLHKVSWIEGFMNVFLNSNIFALALLILVGLFTWAIDI